MQLYWCRDGFLVGEREAVKGRVALSPRLGYNTKMQVSSLLKRLSAGALVTAAGHLALELSNNFLPVAYPLFIEALGLTYSQVGTIALVGIVAGSVLQPLFGYLADRFDARQIALFSIAWIGTVMGLAGFVRSYPLLLVVVVLGGLGSAAFHPAGAALASTMSGSRRGAAMSLFSVGGNAGAALSPLIIGLSIGQLGLRGTAILLPLTWLVTALLYRQLERLPAPTPTGAARGSNVQIGPIVALALVVVMAAARSWYFGALTTYLPEWLQGQGWTPASAGTVLSVVIFTLAGGSIIGGFLSDRLGRAPVILIALLGMGPALWLLLRSGPVFQVLSASLAGMFVGFTFPVTIVMAQEAWPRAVGLASALAIGIGWLPAGIGAWVVGVVADRSTLTTGLTTLFAAPLVGLVAVVIYAIRYRRGGA